MVKREQICRNKETNKDERIFFLSVPLMRLDRDGDYYIRNRTSNTEMDEQKLFVLVVYLIVNVIVSAALILLVVFENWTSVASELRWCRTGRILCAM